MSTKNDSSSATASTHEVRHEGHTSDRQTAHYHLVESVNVDVDVDRKGQEKSDAGRFFLQKQNSKRRLKG